MANRVDKCFDKVDYAEDWIERTQQRFVEILQPITCQIETLNTQMATILVEMPGFPSFLAKQNILD